MNLIAFFLTIMSISHRAVLMPDPIEPPVYLLYPDCSGYEDPDSEKYAQVVHLAVSGAEKIEELQGENLREKKLDSIYSHNLFHVAMHGDSVFLDKYRVFNDTVLERSDIFTKNCKLLYSNTEGISNHGWYRMVFDSASNSYREYRPDPRGSYWNNTDTLIIHKVMKYDSLNRIIQDTEYGAFGKIYYINKYTYDEKGNKKEWSYSLSNEPKWIFSRDSLVNAKWEASFKSFHEEFNIARKVEYIYDQKHREVKKGYLHDDGTVDFFGETKYMDDPKGRCLSKKEYSHGKPVNSEAWGYDEKGRCIMHSDGDQLPNNEERYSWKYDSKDNIIEAIHYWRGEPNYKYRFKIYYK